MCSFPNVCCDFTIWLSFIPLIYIVLTNKTKYSFIYGFISGFVCNILSLFWIVQPLNLYLGIFKASILSLLLWIYVSLYWGVWSFFVKLFSKIVTYNINFIICCSCLWVLLEYIRTYLFTGFPLILIGYSQFKFLSIIQIVEFTGIYGISFIIIFFNFCCYFLLTTNKKINLSIKDILYYKLQYVYISLILFFFIFIIGKVRIHKFSKNFGDDSLKVVIIQPNIEQYKKLDINYINDILLNLERHVNKIAQTKYDLVVWPETAIPACIPQNKAVFKYIRNIMRKTKCCNIIGTVYNNIYGEQSNAIVVIRETSSFLLHKKKHLIPFGEYIPLSFTFLTKVFMPLNQLENFIKGTDVNILKYKNINLGTLICSENFFPEIASQFVMNGARILTNHANDAWFNNTAVLYQHFIMNVFRAVENRKVVMISSNSGISGLIDITGKIIISTINGKSTAISCSVMQNHFKTFYTLHGDIFIKMCFVFVLLMYILYNPYI
ncbi:MAG: apolipoprotein N-acyltransferase [Endomicrobium sp.]|jgi:apolipoprotein N-acyltransferase|nr:apolipoprotein N-acyltransferase [Endomicrobium sp.]